VTTTSPRLTSRARPVPRASRGAATRAARATPPARRHRGAHAARDQARHGRGPAARRHTPRTTSHRRGGASDQSVIRMRRPRPGAKRLNAAERAMLSAELAVAPGAPLADVACGLLAQEPALSKPAIASGATTGATVSITRLSASSAFEGPRPQHQPRAMPLAPSKEVRWAARRASSIGVARHAGQRTACPSAARRRAGAARACPASPSL
jgi:hypothetical protein